MKTTVQLSPRELATVLASLRLWESARFGYIGVPKDRERALHDIATDNQKFEMLSPKSIGRLCERINLSEPPHMLNEVEAKEEDKRYINKYRCEPCNEQWHDEWGCMCNDRCPKCNAEIGPYESEEI